jgi:hypothetical protein
MVKVIMGYGYSIRTKAKTMMAFHAFFVKGKELFLSVIISLSS